LSSRLAGAGDPYQRDQLYHRRFALPNEHVLIGAFFSLALPWASLVHSATLFVGNRTAVGPRSLI
jgi:hypothetical protein